MVSNNEYATKRMTGGVEMKLIKASLVSVLFLSGISTDGWARMGPEFPEFYVRFSEKLDLSDDQLKKIKSIGAAARKEAIKKEAALEIARVELDELLHQDDVDLTRVKAKLSEIASLRAEIEFNSIKAPKEIEKVLTDEQRNRARAIWRELEHRERGMGDQSRDIMEKIERRKMELEERIEDMARRAMERLEETYRRLKENLEDIGKEKMMQEKI